MPHHDPLSHPRALRLFPLKATRIFISSLNAKMAQRFLALVLLPRVRYDVQENKRLHFALFQAMRKAAYKPGAFYKVGGQSRGASNP